MTVSAQAKEYQRVAVRPLNPVIGAEITGVDICTDIDDVAASEIMSALLIGFAVFRPGYPKPGPVCGAIPVLRRTSRGDR